MERLEHLSECELVSFYRGELSAAESRRVVRHLLTGCSRCRDLSAGRWNTEVAQRAPAGTDRFNEIFNRAAQAALRLGSAIEAERREAPALLTELLRHPVERQRLLVANSSRFRSYGLTESLLEAAFQGGFNDPRQAIEHAEVALIMATELSDEHYGRRLAIDLRARAHGTLGNALRIASRLAEAEESIQKGLELASQGTGDPSERARLLSFLASLRTEQRRFDEALSIHDTMLDIYTGLGDRHMMGRTSGLIAIVLRRLGEPAKAIEHSKRAIRQMDATRDPRGALVARQGLAISLFEAGQLEEASSRCAGLRHEWEKLGNDLDVLRCDWMEGKILHRQGRYERAELRLREVRDRFVDLEIPYDAALASLDLAETLFDQGKTAEMGRRLGEAIPIFRGLGIHRETIAALAFLKQATELERVTAGLIKATARFVEESRRNPELRFRSNALTTES